MSLARLDRLAAERRGCPSAVGPPRRFSFARGALVGGAVPSLQDRIQNGSIPSPTSHGGGVYSVELWNFHRGHWLEMLSASVLARCELSELRTGIGRAKSGAEELAVLSRPERSGEASKAVFGKGVARLGTCCCPQCTWEVLCGIRARTPARITRCSHHARVARAVCASGPVHRAEQARRWRADARQGTSHPLDASRARLARPRQGRRRCIWPRQRDATWR